MVESCDLGEEYGVRRTGEDERVIDMIRELPDAVIVKILSSLPIRDAVRTLLIPSFGNLWTYVYNLNFDYCQFHRCPYNSLLGYEYDDGDWGDGFCTQKFRRFVRSVLANHRGDKIIKFCINFDYLAAVDAYYDQDGEIEMDFIRISGEIDSWIEFAVKKGVEILEINLGGCGSPVNDFRHKLTSSPFQSGSLTSLNLVDCGVGMYEINMHMLRSLCLERVDLEGEIMRKFLAGCPLLESLSIVNCFDLEEINCYSRRLNTLRIEHDFAEESKLRVVCPYVTSLNISRGIELMELKNVSGLQDVSIEFSDDLYSLPDDYLKVWKIIESIRHVRAVTMPHSLVGVLTVSELLRLFSPPNSWQHLIVETTLVKWQLPGIRNMLRSSHCLETLYLHVVNRLRPNHEQNAWMQQYEFDESDYWDSPDQSFQLLHLGQSLKSITVTGNVTNCRVLPLLQLLLGKATTLEQLVVTASLDDDDPGCVKKWEEFTEKLPTLPRASSRLAISLMVVPVTKPIIFL